MIFGTPEKIAIEIGDPDSCLVPGHDYVQLRFVVCGHVIGDWDYKVSLPTAVSSARTFLTCRGDRLDESLAEVSSETFFAQTHTAFYEYDYRTQPVLRPNLRDRYHLSEIGGDALCDYFGITVADIDSRTSRVVVKDFRNDSFILDERLEPSDIEHACRQFVEWADERMTGQKD
jgi:hypothetical protein